MNDSQSQIRSPQHVHTNGRTKAGNGMEREPFASNGGDSLGYGAPHGGHVEADAGLPKPKTGFPVLRIVAIAGVLGLVGWIGVRISSATTNQKAVEAKRTETAQVNAALATKPRSVTVVKPVATTWQPVVPFEGTLQPLREADLGFKAGGRMGSVRAKVGDRVKAGQVLASLDASEAQAQVTAAQAQVKTAEAQLALATDSARRTEAMVRSGSQAEASGVQATGQKNLATAQVEAARTQVALASTMLANHVIVAPFAGVISKAPPGEGAVVSPGVAQFHVMDLSSLKIVGTVSEADAGLVAVGGDVVVTADGGPRTAHVTTILGAVDPATRRVPVEALLVNEGDKPLFAGSFVRAQIKGGAPIAVHLLPSNTLRPGSQDEVFVVQSQTLRGRHVQFTNAPNGDLVVRSGLLATDDVLVSPTPESKDGDVVEVGSGAPMPGSSAAAVAPTQAPAAGGKP
ncbi:MAG: efflux RND transporter periplasmic adaptor subunit [Polyangiaceae bacterium]